MVKDETLLDAKLCTNFVHRTFLQNLKLNTMTEDSEVEIFIKSFRALPSKSKWV